MKITPYINRSGILCIPFGSDKKYHWWREGSLAILQILDDINASEEIKEKYRNHNYDGPDIIQIKIDNEK